VRAWGAGLGEHGFLVLTAVVAVLVEVGNKAAVFIVPAPVQPEWKQLVRQVFFAFFKTGRHFLCIYCHFKILSISRWTSVFSKYARPRNWHINKNALRKQPASE
jgi:hypothetical protein